VCAQARGFSPGPFGITARKGVLLSWSLHASALHITDVSPDLHSDPRAESLEQPRHRPFQTRNLSITAGARIHERTHPKARTIPIVVVTGTDTTDLNEADFAYVLKKPVAPSELVFAVDNSLRRAHGRRASAD
jgi:hypothetical protein